MQKVSRRSFMRSSAAAGAGLVFAPHVLGASASTGKPDDINVALIGAGVEGMVLYNAVSKLGARKSGIKFRAVCDIAKGPRERLRKTFKKYKRYGFNDAAYEDYKEMLDTEKDLDAVIIATPDFWHSPQTVDCLNAGIHVYCEKEMSNTLEGAKKMMDAGKSSGKLLQIGHQRRSNPRYKFCYDKIIKEAQLLGRITTINGQWNRSRAACVDKTWTKDEVIPEATLKKYGYKNMQQFANWRNYKGLGGGPIVDLGSHQIDIYSWFLGANPKSVMATGGTDYWKHWDWYDNVMAMFEYETKAGPVRATYQTTTTTGSGGYFEKFMGDRGCLEISEASSTGSVFREKGVPEKDWDKWVKKDYMTKLKEEVVEEDDSSDSRLSPKPPEYSLNVEMNDPFHQPHLVNFFESIRGNDTLNCPGEIGYETAVAVLKVNEAVAAGKKLEFKPGEFHA
jgi:predicted dehydrogenase